MTQNRKGNGKRIYYTAQRYNRVDKVFRELSFLVGDCRTIMGRYTRVRWFDTEDYEMLLSSPDVNKRMKISSGITNKAIRIAAAICCFAPFLRLTTCSQKASIIIQSNL